MSYGDSESLLTLGQNGTPPETRMKDALACQSFVRRLLFDDAKRSLKRARVNGLVDGNPPYKNDVLKKAGRAEACNVNWGTARAYLEASSGSFYDLSSEAPSTITFKTAYGNDEQREQWSNDASECANEIFRKNAVWDYHMQLSQWQMVLHGKGPFLFEDGYRVFPRAVRAGEFMVPEFTESETSEWEVCVVQVMYRPVKLFDFIRNEKAATTAGWNVKYTQDVIRNALDIRQQNGILYDWEWYQQELKNNSLTYYDDSKVCRLAFVFWKEFDGTITEAIVERDTASGLVTKYLYFSRGKYAQFSHCVHPMYFDRGNGGYDHSVTGLGVKMYSAMEFENRTLCNMADKMFSPKTLFKPTTAEASQRFSLAHLGDYASVPYGWDIVQNPIQGMMGELVAGHELLNEVMQQNLSMYRQPIQPQTSGNPPTKFQKQMEAAFMSALNKTQYSRYYQQLDALYTEMWRRLANPNSTDKWAMEFQEKCKGKGVPVEALNRPAYVGATRVVGQGSAFMRKQAIDSIFPIAGAISEEGRVNLINDKIAAEAGQAAVSRYNPTKKTPLATDQQAEAMLWVSAMKQGIAPIMTSSQNAVTFAATFLNAAVQSLGSLQKGADPHEVLAFLEIAGPAIAAYLARFGKDPTRQQIHEQMSEQWKKLAKATDDLKKAMMKQAQDQKAQQQKTQQALTDEQIKSRKAQADISIKVAKTKAQLQQSGEKHRMKMRQDAQDLAISDAKAASEIHINRLKAFQSNGEGE